MSTDRADGWFERHWAEMPEGKLELIGGKLIISTLAGSRRVLQDYGPALFLPMAPPELWWRALEGSYSPRPRPGTLSAWHDWADHLAYEPEVPAAGPRGTARHRRTYDIMHWGL